MSEKELGGFISKDQNDKICNDIKMRKGDIYVPKTYEEMIKDIQRYTKLTIIHYKVEKSVEKLLKIFNKHKINNKGD